ncbi:MAG: diaminopimelate decarboxylase [Deltaproteobacteria bacterium]|jgi:diaminopimelate decarboxylase|nr:diaminopimelate decarboxylase [Deltaproteobacteria bacterium]
MNLNYELFNHIVEMFRGQLPVYVYDLDFIREKYRKLKALFTGYTKDGGETHILYAMKANWSPSVIKALYEEGAGIDVVSPAEIFYANALGVPLERMLFTVNNISETDLHEICLVGTPLFNLGSLDELELYGKNYPGSKVCIRFNPLLGIKAGAHKFVQTTGKEAKFGILLEHKEQVLEIVKKHNLKVIGLHQHTGSCIIEHEKFAAAIKGLLSVAEPQDFPNLEFVDFGGGLYVRYADNDSDFDYQSFANEVIGLLELTNQKYNKKLRLHFEPGKFLSAECGYLITEVMSVKDNQGYKIAGTNSGMNHLMRPVLYDAWHEVFNLSNPQGQKFEYDVVGNICESGDFFAKRRLVPEIRKGDVLVLGNAGAYCETMSSFYNMRSLPAEVVVQNANPILTRKRLSNTEFAKFMLGQYGNF